MLVALHRLEDQGKAVCNFEMVYDEYRAIKQDAQKHMWRRGACLRAFECLAACGLARFLDARVDENFGMTQYAAIQLEVTKPQTEAGMKANAECPDYLKHWLNNESVVLSLGSIW